MKNQGYTISYQGSVQIVVFEASPSATSIKEAIEAMAAEKLSDKRVWDFSQSGFTLSPEEIRNVASFAGITYKQPSRVALVASEDLSFGLSRSYNAYRENSGTELEVFRTREEALEWIDGE